jgi:choline kinase
VSRAVQQAVILAAGRGRRLGEGMPKCLVRLGDRALIHHQLDALRAAGIDEVCVVVGYGAERVRGALGDRCHYIDNPRFDETNSLYSLWLTRAWVRGPFLQINSDLAAHPEIYRRLLSAGGTALAYDSLSGDGEEHMKVVIRNGLLQDIEKRLDPARSCGENLGLLRYDRVAARILFEEAGALIAGGAERSWAPAALARLAQRVPVQCIDMAGLPWSEIDFVEDVLYARCEVLPELRGVQRPGGAARRRPGLGALVLKALSTMGGVFENPSELG